MKSLRTFAFLSTLAVAAAAQAPLYDLSGQPGDRYGHSVAWVGDVDGDGLEDIAVGATHGDGLQPDAGYVLIRAAKDAKTIVKIRGERTGDLFGWAIAGLGDVDGDGAGDLVIGAPGHEWTAGTDRGASYVFSGATGAQIKKLGGSADGDQFGWAVAGPGDIDGDGIPDYATGVPGSDIPQTDTGRVWVHSGANNTLLRQYSGQAAGDRFGSSLAAVGDVNGDGVPDLLAGAPGVNSGFLQDVGRGYVLSGAASNTVVFSRTGTYVGGQLGYAVAGGLDADLDGVPDAIFGEPFANANGSNSGRALLISGATQAVLHSFTGSFDELLGTAVGGMRDVDLDGHGDLIVGAPAADVPPYLDIGVAKVFSGKSGALLFQMNGHAAGEGFGSAVAGAGRLNADAATDVIAGSPSYGGLGPDGGRVRVVLGSAPYPKSYCTAKTNSAGCLPKIGFTGCASFSAGNYFVLHGYDVLPNVVGILIWSLQPDAVPFHGGTLCLASPVKRTPAQFSIVTGPGTCDARYEFLFNQTYMSSQGLAPGMAVYAQYWSRDNGFAPPNNVGLTGGLEFITLP